MPRQEIKIGVLGNTRSGKTTFLASLPIAAGLHKLTRWKIIGDPRNTGSQAFLDDQTEKLGDGFFPPPTLSGRLPDYGFVISGKLPRRWVAKMYNSNKEKSFARWFAKTLAKTASQVTFHFDVRDYRGTLLTSRPSSGRDGGNISFGPDEQAKAREDVWNYLADCQGIIYLYDATEEGITGSFRALLGTINQLLARKDAKSPGHLSLDHYLAVCLTKYDHPEIFSKLQEAGLVTIAGGIPHISDPKKAFELFAPEELRNNIQAVFGRRVRYFVTSSIGFYQEDSNTPVDLEDYRNTLYASDTHDAILRGAPRPIGVLDPLIEVYRQVRNRDPQDMQETHIE